MYETSFCVKLKPTNVLKMLRERLCLYAKIKILASVTNSLHIRFLGMVISGSWEWPYPVTGNGHI